MPFTAAELTKNGDLKIAGNINTRLPIVSNGLLAHFPFDGTVQKYIPGQIRYFREKTEGSTANTSNHWNEIQIIDYDGNNLALGKTVTNILAAAGSLACVTDGIVDGLYVHGGLTVSADPYVHLDLGALYNIKQIKVWHYYPDGRTYHKVKTEVSDNGSDWYVIFDSAIEGEYAETSGGKVHDLTNLGNTGRPSTNTNTTITNDGIGIEAAKENLLSTMGGGAAQDWSKWTHFGSGGTQYYWSTLSTQYDDPVWGKVYKGINGGANDSGSYIYDYSSYAYAVGDILTFSCWVKIDRTQDISTNFYVISYAGGQHDVAPSNPKTISFRANEWQYVTWTTGAVTETVTSSNGGFGVRIYNTSGITFEFAYPQFEKNKFSHLFVDGTKSSATLEVPFNAGSDFTIFYRFKPNVNWSIYYGSTAYDKRKWYLYDKLTGKKIWYSDYANNTAPNSNPWIGFDEFVTSSYSPWHWHAGSNSYSGQTEYWFAITKSGAIWSKYLISDLGYIKQQTTHTDQALIDFTPSKMQFIGEYDYVLRNLTVYNRALSENEIKQLGNPNFELTKIGDLITSQIIMKPNNLPVDAKYFPLGFDGQDVLKSISPSINNNTIFDNGSLWVGQTAINRFTTPNFNTSNPNGGWPHWGSAGNIGTYGQNTDPKYIYGNQSYSHWVANGSGATANYIVYQEPLETGQITRSLSAIICMDDGSPVTNSKVIPGWNGTQSGSIPKAWTSIEQLGDSKFYYCKAEGIIQNGTIANDYLACISVYPGYKVYVSWMQLENTGWSTPFVNGTRIGGDIKWPLTFTDNATFIFWRKGCQIGSSVGSTGQGSCPNIFEVGDYYSNSSFTLWNYSSANQIYVLGKNNSSTGAWSFATSPGNYLDEVDRLIWHQHAIVFSGSSNQITNYKVYKDAVPSANYITGDAGASITSWSGSFFGMGSHGGAQPNAWYKDLIYVPRALSDTEVLNIYNEKMQIYKTGTLQIQGSILTRQTLT